VLLALLGGVVLLLLPRISPDPESGGEGAALRGERAAPPGSEGWIGPDESAPVPPTEGTLEDEATAETLTAPGEGAEGIRPPAETPESGESGTTGGGGSRTRSRPPILDPAFHEKVLRELPKEQTVSYLAIRVRQLASDTLRQFPRSYPEERLAVRRQVEYLNGRVSARKRAAAQDAEAFETLREDLLRLDRSLEAWRARVLAGEPEIPEIDL
jgi:hypothetical protein